MAKGVKKKENNLIKWIFIGLIILAILLLVFKIFFTGQVVRGTKNSTSVTLYLNTTNPSANVTFSGKSYLVSLFSSKFTGIGTLVNVSGKPVTVFQTTGAFITVKNSSGNITKLINFSTPQQLSGLYIALINATHTVSAGQIGYISLDSALVKVSITNLTSTTSQTSTTGPTVSSSCFSVGQSGCLNDRSKSCCAGLTCQGTGQGTCAPAPTCTPKTCLQLGKTCGSVSDGCSKTLNCGACQKRKMCVNGKCLGTYGDYCTTGSQCYTGRCKPLTRFLWYTTGNYCY